MTTQVPDNVLIPDEVDTRLGTLKFFDGVPTEETAAKVWDHLDFSRAVESMIMTTPAASLAGFRRGIREYGPDNETAIIWESRLDSKGLLLTGNTTVIYLFMWIDTKSGPVVMETPPNVLAILDNFWFHYVTDIGNAGPDTGSQYVIGLRDSEGEILNGSKTYTLHIPANVQAERFWEITVYDNQTRCMLQTDQRLPGVTSIQSDVVQNKDGSYDITFGPEKPEGKVNWVQTIPGKSWFIALRIYGPEQPWIDQTWRPGEIELVK